MKNVNIEVKGKKLIVTCDLEQDFGPSNTGKTTIVASTEGPTAVPGFPTIKLGLNLYKKPNGKS